MNKILVPKELSQFSEVLKNLKQKNIIKTNNLVGDLGEYYCKELFNIKLNLSTVEKGFDGFDCELNKVEIKTRRNPSNSAKVIFRSFDFNYCLYVELNEIFEPTTIYKIERQNLVENLDKKGDRLSVSRLRKINNKVVYKHYT